MLKKSIRSCVVLTLLIVLGIPAVAGEKSGGPWIQLFDGKSLDGWIQRNGTATYKAEDGMITGETKEGSPNSFLCTERDYVDFELEYDVKADPRLNSGVQIRSESKSSYQNGRVHGYQVEIDSSDRAWSGGIYDEARRGWLNDLENNEPARKAFKPGEWNHFRVLAKGDSIETWVNDVPAADLNDSMTPSGFIGLQVHSFDGNPPAKVHWKNIRIREFSKKQSLEEIPKTDLHVHLARNLNLQRAIELQNELGVKFGIVQNFGQYYPNNTNQKLKKFIEEFKDRPVYFGIQAEGRNWMTFFDKALYSKLDYILADGMTMPDKDGNFVELWRPEQVKIDDPEDFMDRYTDYLASIAGNEPIDILANVSFLPDAIREDYKKLWTDRRMLKVINAASRNGVAIEINSIYEIPSARFITLAKKSGCKFSFGSNSHGSRMGDIAYCMKMVKECGLTKEDIFVPGNETE